MTNQNAPNPGGRPVTDDLPLATALVRGAGLITDICATAAAERHLTAPQAQLLCVLTHRPLAMAQLAVVLRINKSSATGLIDRAEAAGLVERSTDREDRRSQLVTLTSSGGARGEAYRALVARRLESLIADVPGAERDVLRRVLSAVVPRHQAHSTWRPMSPLRPRAGLRARRAVRKEP